MNIERYYYLLVNLGCIIIPLCFSFHPKIQFYKNFKGLFTGILVMMLVFIPWDILFTMLGVWGFNEKYLTGLLILNLPIEEILFFICIPFACLFTYHCMKLFLKDDSIPATMNKVAWVLAYLSVVLAFMFYDRYYTFVSHFICSMLLFYHLIIFKSNYIGRFILTFLILLIPFIISNGILTGINFIEYPFINTEPENIYEKIVWYDNEHNLRVRIFSMPIDDLSYGLTMLLLITSVYERMANKSGRR